MKHSGSFLNTNSSLSGGKAVVPQLNTLCINQGYCKKPKLLLINAVSAEPLSIF
jgi:hypothetical protein